MYIVFLIFMALCIGYLAVPLARELGYAYGRFGRVQDILLILVGTLLFGVAIVALLSWLGAWTGGDVGALILGFIGALLTVGLLTVFSARAAAHEEQLSEIGDDLDTSSTG